MDNHQKWKDKWTYLLSFVYKFVYIPNFLIAMKMNNVKVSDNSWLITFGYFLLISFKENGIYTYSKCKFLLKLISALITYCFFVI